jgi:GNAT superfamily N-acetyltransferase
MPLCALARMPMSSRRPAPGSRMSSMEIRSAVAEDAPALGRVMVESFLAGHRGQMPDAAWQKRVTEWTPEVSAEAWSRFFVERSDGRASRDVLLVADDEAGVPVALALGTGADDERPGAIGELAALYVLPDRQGQGVGRALLHRVAGALAELGFTSLQVGVLTANLPARGFYEAMGGREHDQTTVDEEGYLLPVTVYVWPDLASLAGGVGRP